jgi:MFS family permease
VTFPSHERARAIGIFGGVGGSASVFGLALGGLLVQWNVFDLEWRPIFLVNIPVGLVALTAAWFVVRDSRSPAAPKLDPIGMALAISAVTLLVYPLTEGRRLGWPTWTFVMMAGAAGVFAVFLAFERRRAAAGASPLIEFDVFRSRAFSVGLAGWLLFMIALGGVFLVWTLYMQAGLGWTPLHAGLTAVTFAVGAGVGAGSSPDLLVPRFGRAVLMAGTLINAAGFGGYAWLAWHYGANISSWQMIAPLVVSGIGFGMVVAPSLDMLLGQVPSDEAGAASGLLNTAQQLGMALGVALVGVVFFTQLDHTSGHGVDTVAAETRAELGLPDGIEDEILSNFRACVHDRSAAVDPTVAQASCRPTESNEHVAAVLAHAGVKANAENFSRTFGYTLWYGIGILVLVCLGFLALPKNARIEHIEPASPVDVVIA